MKILVTGSAGFIGYHISEHFLNTGNNVIGIDNLNDYYSPNLKKYRNNLLLQKKNFTFKELDISSKNQIEKLFQENEFDIVLHLAAQAGVRLPLGKLNQYTLANLVGFENIASQVKTNQIPIFFYASSSSVYGDVATSPLTEDELHLKPNSYYGATKLSNEIAASALFSNTFHKVLGLRFFSVYGPLGRPDMAYFKLLRSAILNENFNLFGDGTIKRDFTYIADVIKSVSKLIEVTIKRNSPYCEVINIGGGQPMSMMELINIISKLSNSKINVNMMEENKDDSVLTCANTSKILEWTGIKPEVKLHDGIKVTYDWMKSMEILPILREWI